MANCNSCGAVCTDSCYSTSATPGAKAGTSGAFICQDGVGCSTLCIGSSAPAGACKDECRNNCQGTCVGSNSGTGMTYGCNTCYDPAKFSSPACDGNICINSCREGCVNTCKTHCILACQGCQSQCIDTCTGQSNTVYHVFLPAGPKHACGTLSGGPASGCSDTRGVGTCVTVCVWIANGMAQLINSGLCNPAGTCAKCAWQCTTGCWFSCYGVCSTGCDGYCATAVSNNTCPCSDKACNADAKLPNTACTAACGANACEGQCGSCDTKCNDSSGGGGGGLCDYQSCATGCTGSTCDTSCRGKCKHACHEDDSKSGGKDGEGCSAICYSHCHNACSNSTDDTPVNACNKLCSSICIDYCIGTCHTACSGCDDYCTSCAYKCQSKCIVNCKDLCAACRLQCSTHCDILCTWHTCRACTTTCFGECVKSCISWNSGPNSNSIANRNAKSQIPKGYGVSSDHRPTRGDLKDSPDSTGGLNYNLDSEMEFYHIARITDDIT